MKFIYLILVMGIIAIFSAYFFWTNLQSNFFATSKYPIDFYVKPGIGLDGIATQAETAGLIKSKTAFKIYALLSGQAHRLQSGDYEIDRPISIPALTEMLSRGPEEISITIAPGETLKEIDDGFSRLKILKPGDLTFFSDFDNLKIASQNLEGFLLPDTYHFYRHSNPNFVVRKILDNFQKQVIPLTNNSKNTNLYDTIKIASLLEKEVPDFQDQRIVAGIIEKRLKIRMPLQIDAAILYAKCSGRFLGCPSLTKKDFHIDSPYNTYLRLGLPPTPISNPGIKTIEAAFKKKDSGYWYYLSDPNTKKTIFSIDLNEQAKNRYRYLKN